MTTYSGQSVPTNVALVSRSDTGLTGPNSTRLRLVEVRMDNFLITVAVDDQGHFQGVTKVVAAGDFLTPMQRLASSGFHDVDAFYRDEAP